MRDYPFWCEHRQRGRVAFDAGALSLAHGLAALEVATARVELPTDLRDHAHRMSIMYISLNDMLNLVVQLRSVPDLATYLDARVRLPVSGRCSVGGEQQLCIYIHAERREL